MSTRIQLRRGTAATWTSVNPLLAAGEQGVETDTGYVKIGDGVTAWASLAYASLSPSVVSGGSGTHAARPTPSTTSPQIYYESDTGLSFFWDGTTWQLIKPGGELGYAQITGSASTASLTLVAVTGLTTTVTISARPVMVVFDAQHITNTVAGDGVEVHLFEDGTDIGYTVFTPNGNGTPALAHREVRRAPSPGSHTYSAQIKADTGGTALIGASLASPAFIQVREV